MRPSIGRIVHYVSYGTPNGEYKSECRAAIVTTDSHLVSGTFTTAGGEAIGLCVLNPEGMFFKQLVLFDDAGAGGTWHWPERVEWPEHVE
jgi:hypothetical protein